MIDERARLSFELDFTVLAGSTDFVHGIQA
jgi:hypothetical protein